MNAKGIFLKKILLDFSCTFSYLVLLDLQGKMLELQSWAVVHFFNLLMLCQ